MLIGCLWTLGKIYFQVILILREILFLKKNKKVKRDVFLENVINKKNVPSISNKSL